MSVHSMTGFARAEVTSGGARFVWELKSVNARGFDLRVRLPAGLERLEPEMRERARERLKRGSCFFSLAEDRAAALPSLRLNEQALALAVAAARRLAEEEGIEPPTADGILAIPGVLAPADAAADEAEIERREADLLEGFERGLVALAEARAEEGERLQAVLIEQLDGIEAKVGEASALAEEAPEAIKARIAEQVALLTGQAGLDPDRLHQEAVLLAARADVREEIDRLTGHVAAAREQLAGGGTIGRRLDFLAQEFNREANTLSAKAFDKRLVAVGVELKAMIDQLREQVQNLE
ncbi:MAG TPA: YicC/YloC family endoribonuclease [Afifellaceae bacterium]|nr:YicC/YloC family endoribonuclease [Afifellaceae bacterium]